MERSLSLVHLEQTPGVTRGLVQALEADGFCCTLTSVRSEPALCRALEAGGVDLTFYSVGGAGADAASTIKRARLTAPSVPVITFLPADNPSAEIEMLKAGAVECLVADRLGRLGWAVRRAMGERDECERRERIQSEIASLEAQLHHAQRLTNVARLAGGVAHDFNNLLTIINGCCQLLLRAVADGDELRPLIEPIEQAGARGAELTRRLLAFSRPEPFESTLLNLNDVIRDVQPMLAPLLGERVRLSVNLDPSLWVVRADPGEMSQVVLNLVTNARDAMADGGTVTIRTGNIDMIASSAPSPGSFVELVVRDAGCGMDEAVRARIFDPFFTTKPRGQGTGIGLATVHRIVAQSGGEIDVETAPGRGTTMRVRLPRVDAAVRGSSAVSSLDEPAPAAGSETVLVVEDEIGVRGVICGFLRGGGYRVLEAADADAAQSLCRSHDGSIDLLVTDVVLPGASGPRLAAALRTSIPALRTLFISGYPADALTDVGFDRATGFLPKPFSREVLLHRVRKILTPSA